MVGVGCGGLHELHLLLQTSSKIFEARILNHLLLFINQTLDAHRELLAGFREAAPPFRGQVLAGPRGRGGGAAGSPRELPAGRCSSWWWM